MENQKEKVAIIAVKREKDNLDLEELKGLIEALNGEVVCTLIQKRKNFDPATYIGKGKLEELKKLKEHYNFETAVAYHKLTPSQIRNLEEALNVKVLDKSDVILEIFKRRAKTKIAKMQVELAFLMHKLSRLRGKGIYLDNPGMRGKGETLLEIEKRSIKQRIYKLRKEIEDLSRHYELTRESRKKQGFKTVAIVGYTNAGKSTLLKALTKEDVFIKNMPFATLDTKTKKVYHKGKYFLVTDTVGFIKDLPHELVASFKATLEESKYSDLLLIVIDITDKDWETQYRTVKRVLKELKAWDNKKKLVVLNKVDNFISDEKDLENFYHEICSLLKKENIPYIFISAKKGWNLEKLKDKILELLEEKS